MRYKLLGKSGLRVSEFCLGTMTFGETWGWGASKEESQKQFDMFADAGGNFIDTSVNYTDGTSETFIGEFLKGQREKFVIATKYTLTKPDAIDPNSGGNSRKNMMQSVERSLTRLQTDYIDVYYLHAWDFMTPVAEIMRGLDDLVSSGKVNYVAVSDTPAWIAAEANTLAELRGWSSFIGVQAPYSLLRRDLEHAILPLAKHWDMAVMAWGIIGGGLLTGKYHRDHDEPTRMDRDSVQLSEKKEATIQMVADVAEEAGRSMAQVAINWVRQQQHQAHIIPILGARSAKHLADNLSCLEWELSEEQLARLNEVSKPDLLFPHGFLEANPYIFGATFAKIDNHRL